MDLKSAIDRFLKDLSITKSPNTVQAYSFGLGHLLSAVGNIDVSEMVPNVVPQYVRWLHENRDITQASLNVYLAALSLFYEWLVLGEYTTEDSLRFQHWCKQFRKKVKTRPPKVPDEDLVQKVLEEVRTSRPTPDAPGGRLGRNQTLRWLRDRALIETLRCTGCRVDEVLRLRNKDLKKGKAVVRGKGNKRRTVFWDDQGWQAIREYLIVKDAPLDDAVFVRHKKTMKEGAISHAMAREIVYRWTKRAAPGAHLNPHQFRHRFATKVLEKTNNLALAQDLLGHESPETTRIYTQYTTDQLEKGHGRVKF